MHQHLYSNFENKVILVVEDDYDIGDILEKYLKNEGMQVVRAMHGIGVLKNLFYRPHFAGYKTSKIKRLGRSKYHSTTQQLTRHHIDCT